MHSNDTTISGPRVHHLHIQQKINIIRSTKVVFFAGLSSWVVHLFVHPLFYWHHVLKTWHTVLPNHIRDGKHTQGFKWQSDPCVQHPFWPFIKFAFTDLFCFTFSWFAVLVDPFGLTAMLMRQLKFLALASLTEDQFCRLASGGRSQHSLLPA